MIKLVGFQNTRDIKKDYYLNGEVKDIYSDETSEKVHATLSVGGEEISVSAHGKAASSACMSWLKSISELENPKTESEFLLQSNEHELHTVTNKLSALCYGLSKDAGWYDKPVENGTRIALIHSELSEALEGLRKDLMDDHLPHRKMVEVEMADAVIRIMDFCGSNGLDIGGAIVEKLKYNVTREDHKREVRAQKGGKAF